MKNEDYKNWNNEMKNENYRNWNNENEEWKWWKMNWKMRMIKIEK